MDSRGRPHGHGSLVFAQGDRYDGEFEGGRRSGRGAYTYANGDVYTGMWKKDVREGDGVLRYSNGDVYNGQWANDARSGEGSLVFADGGSFVGQWRDDAYDHGSLLANDGSCIPGWKLPQALIVTAVFNRTIQLIYPFAYHLVQVFSQTARSKYPAKALLRRITTLPRSTPRTYSTQ